MLILHNKIWTKRENNRFGEGRSFGEARSFGKGRSFDLENLSNSLFCTKSSFSFFENKLLAHFWNYVTVVFKVKLFYVGFLLLV